MATLKILSSSSLIPWGIATVNAVPDATFLFIQDQALWSQDGKCRTRPEAMAVHFFLQSTWSTALCVTKASEALSKFNVIFSQDF